jgi:hypothetical protein
MADGTTGDIVILISTGIGTGMYIRASTATGMAIHHTGLTRSMEEDFTTGTIAAITSAFRPVTAAALSLCASTSRALTAIARPREA